MNVFVRWHGGKSRQLKFVNSLLPTYINNYIEPFVGAGSIFSLLKSKSNKCFISDKNEALINSYVNVRDNLVQVINYLEQFKHDDYYLIRQRFNEANKIGPLQAARMLWLIVSCFGRGWRNNRKGEFNFSKGFEYKSSFDHLYEWNGFIQGQDFQCLDFHEALNNIEFCKDDFVFFDPPYLKGAYSPGFNIEHHKLLFDWCKYLDSLKVNWLMSNAGDEIKEIFKEYTIIDKWIQRTCGGDLYRNNITEELWIKNY